MSLNELACQSWLPQVLLMTPNCPQLTISESWWPLMSQIWPLMSQIWSRIMEGKIELSREHSKSRISYQVEKKFESEHEKGAFSRAGQKLWNNLPISIWMESDNRVQEIAENRPDEWCILNVHSCACQSILHGLVGQHSSLHSSLFLT